MDLNKLIRDVPDFPKKGIIFKDITTLLKHAQGFRFAVELMAGKYPGQKIDKVIGIESRGFIFGAVLAYKIGAGFIAARKPGKLPADTIKEEYALEYGTNTIELHTDAIKPGEKVVIVDDLLATGGTARAVANLVEKLEGKIVAFEFLVELEFLQGKNKLKGYNINSYLKY